MRICFAAITALVLALAACDSPTGGATQAPQTQTSAGMADFVQAFHGLWQTQSGLLAIDFTADTGHVAIAERRTDLPPILQSGWGMVAGLAQTVSPADGVLTFVDDASGKLYTLRVVNVAAGDGRPLPMIVSPSGRTVTGILRVRDLTAADVAEIMVDHAANQRAPAAQR